MQPDHAALRSCVEDGTRTLAGVAMSRGYAWGQATFATMRARGKVSSTWPSYDEWPRVRMLATGKVADLARDERLREQLARLCAADAARSYGKKTS